jgi:hypothetical protein
MITLATSCSCGSNYLLLDVAFRSLIRQPLTFRINACVMFLPSQCRRTCNQKQHPVTALSCQCRMISSLVRNFVDFDTSSMLHLHSDPLHSPDALRHLLTPTLNNLPFEQSTLRRFVHSCCQACTADQLPSLIQLRSILLKHASRDTLQPNRQRCTKKRATQWRIE